MLAGKTVVVGITVGVAAHYKPELIGQLRYRHLAPAMHDTMWVNPILQRNLAQLQVAKYRVIPPERGLLADGEMGTGRMASIPASIKILLDLAQKHPNKTEDYKCRSIRFDVNNARKLSKSGLLSRKRRPV
jgi:phosphopantothenoylcysteine synthetase/decarboxylase